MNRRQCVLLVLLAVMLLVAGCTKTKPTAEMVPVKPATAAPATPVPPTPAPPSAAPTQAPVEAKDNQPAQAMPTAAPVELEQPEMPPEKPVPAGQVVDLGWGWKQGISSGQWYELQVKPDREEDEFEVFRWLQEPKIRITSADLLPGVYLWRVIVVEGRDDMRGDEISAMSVERRFILTRPAVSGRGVAVPTVEAMPTETPEPTNTPYIIYWTPVPPTATNTPDPYAQPTATETVVGPTPTGTPDPYSQPTPTETAGAPTATSTVDPYPQPTATQTTGAPTATFTPDPYPQATNTPAPRATATPTTQAPAPTATSGAYGLPTATTSAPTATTSAPTATTAPAGPTATTAAPTAYP